MSAKHFIASVFIAILLMLGCSDDAGTNGELTFNFPDSNLSWVQDIRPIFLNSCAISGCHTAPNPQNGLDLGLDPPTFSSDTRLVVVPFSKEASLLYRLVIGPSDGIDRMPRQGRLLAEEEIKALGTWIDEGANTIR